jgi:hypothetical protein
MAPLDENSANKETIRSVLLLLAAARMQFESLVRGKENRREYKRHKRIQENRE